MQGEASCSTEVTARAEYIMETNIITIIPIYNNYQDIRTFYTIKAQQTYRFTLFHPPDLSFSSSRFSAPPGAWLAEVSITKCRLRAAEPGGSSCPVQILTSTHAIPQREVSAGEMNHQFGDRYGLAIVSFFIVSLSLLTTCLLKARCEHLLFI